MEAKKRVKSRTLSQNSYVLAENTPKNASKRVKSRTLGRTADQEARTMSGLEYTLLAKPTIGALGVIEGATDLITGTVAGIFGNKEYKDYVFQYDNWVQDLNQKVEEKYNPKTVGKFVGDVASGLGQSATMMIPYVGQILFFTGIMGNAISAASQKTGKTGAKEYIYGAGSAAIEWALERFIGGEYQSLEALGKSAVKNVGSKVTKNVAKTAGKNTARKMVASQIISSAVGEGMEEFLGNVGDYGWQRIMGIDRESEFNWSEAGYSFLVGMTSGAFMGSVSTATQSAYEIKNGAQINADAKRRDTMLAQARGLLDMAEAQGLTHGSDKVANHLTAIRAGLTTYESAKDKDSRAANKALGKINIALMSAEFNIITDRHAEYIAKMSEENRDQLAEYANAYFKDAGVTVTAKDLTDVNNEITRALATLDWAGKVVQNLIGEDRIVNAEIAERMEAQMLSDDEKKKIEEDKRVRTEIERLTKEAIENAKPIADGASWNGEKVSYRYTLNDKEGFLTIEPNADGTYKAYLIEKGEVQPLNKLTAEQVKVAIENATKGEFLAEKNKRSKGEETSAEQTETAENAEKAGESDTKLSLSEEREIATVEIKTDPKLAKLIAESDRSKYDIIREYLIANFHGQTFTMSDGKKAIMDKRDAKHLAHLADEKKTAELSNLREIIEKAVLTVDEVPADHKKFATFSYYSVNVQYNSELLPIKINVGKSKSDGDYHIYDITPDKKRRAAHEASPHVARVTGTGALKNSSSEDSISQPAEKINTSGEKNPDTTSKGSIGPDSVPMKESGDVKKTEEEYVEKAFKASPAEVKAAMKAVKNFKLLPASTREAIIEMMRSGKGIDKVTLESIAVFMASREGLNVRFMKGHRAEGSHDVLDKSGQRLILLNPEKMNGKHYRADIFFHELYHDFAATGQLAKLSKAIYETVDKSFQHAVADMYTGYNNDGMTISKYLNGKKWTKENVAKYFEEYMGISFDAVMEEVAAGTMGRVVGSQKFISRLRQNGILKSVYYGVVDLCRVIANRAVQVGGDNSAGFVLTFRDALRFKSFYSFAEIASGHNLSPAKAAELKEILANQAENDEKIARTKMSISGVQYNIEQLKNNAIDVTKMESIATVGEHEFEADGKTSLKEKVIAFFNSVGNNAIHPELGDIALTASSFSDDRGHGLTRNKIKSFKAIPIAIEKGKVIDVYQPTGKTYERITIAAPIMIEEGGRAEQYYIGVMVQRDKQSQRLYLHDVITEKATLSFTTEPTAQNGEGIRDEGHLYITSILQKALSVNTKLSLSLEDYTPTPMYPVLPSTEEIEVELNERDWGFDWADDNIRKNLATVHKYLEEHYPDFEINIQVNRERDHIKVNRVSYAMDVNKLLTQDAEIHEFLLSLGFKEAQIGKHLALFSLPSEKVPVIKSIEHIQALDKAYRPRVYQKSHAAKGLEDILANTISPIVNGKTMLKGKKKNDLVVMFWKLLNGAKTKGDKAKVARALAHELITNAVYNDFVGTEDYQALVAEGVIENYEAINAYRKKLDVATVLEDAKASVGARKANGLRKRWGASKDGISPRQAFEELQAQGFLVDLEATNNEADILIAIDKAYSQLREQTEMTRTTLALSEIDKDKLSETVKKIETEILQMFEKGGEITPYGKLVKRYQELLAQNESQYRSEIEKIERQLTSDFEKRIEKMQKDLDKSRDFWKKRGQEARYGRDYAKKTNSILADSRRLRDFVNRDYTAADQMEDRQMRDIAKAFLKAVTKTRVRVTEARAAARLMLQWAKSVKENDETFIGPLGSGTLTQEEYNALGALAIESESLTDEELKEYGLSREKYEAAMAARRESEALSMEELEMFHTVLRAAIRNYNSYGKEFKDGRWRSLDETVRKAIEQQQTALKEEQRDGLIAKAGRFIRKIGLQFLDPLSAAAALDGYRYDGVFQEFFNELAYAEAEKNKMIKDLRAPFEEYLEKHKKYKQRLSEEVIELTPDIKITVGQAITFTEMYKRDQAKAAMAISRIAFNMDDGTVRKLEGYGEKAFLSTPNGKKIDIATAKDVQRLWYSNKRQALATLQEYGYNVSLREGDSEASFRMAEDVFEQFQRDLTAAESDAMKVWQQFGDQRKQLVDDINKQFTEEDREFIKLISDFFQQTSKDIKTKADLRNLGYTNVIEGYYFPIKRRSADMAKSLADGTFFSDFVTTVNLSFNHSTMQGAKASIDIHNVWSILTEHIEGLAMWENLYLPIQNINKVWNKNIGTSTEVVTVKNIVSERTDGDWSHWLADLLLDVQGARRKETQTLFDKIINKLRSTYAVYQLGLNPQTVVKQTLTWAAASQYLSPASIMKGLLHPGLNRDQLDRVSAVAAERTDDATVIRAMSNTEKFSSLAEKTMFLIPMVDRGVNIGLFAMCQEEVAANDPSKPINSEENLVAAGKLVSEIILKVQDSSDVMTKSQAARSSNEFLKMFTMFRSSAIKMFSRLFENIGFVMRYRALAKTDAAQYEAQYKKAQKQLGRSVGALGAVAVMTALIVQLFKSLYNKDREDKEGNEITFTEDVLTDTATEIVGVVPIVGDVVDYLVNGYEVSTFFEDTFNSTLQAVTQMWGLGEKVVTGDVIEDWEVGSMLRKVSRVAGSLTGIPVRNVENTLSGIVRRVSPEAGYTYDTLFYNANYAEDVNKALKEGDTELAAHIVELMMKRDKTGNKVYSEETINTIVALRNLGYDNIFPKSPNSDITKRKQMKAYLAVYQKADAAVEKLVTSKEFKAMADYATDESSPQATAIKTLYNGYYDLAEHDVLGKELTRAAAYFTVTDPHNLMLVKAYDKAIKLETVEIKGARKTMLKAYMKSLGMDETAQAYAAYSCGYRTDDVKSVIFSDLKGKENEDEILIALGLKEADTDEKEDEAA